VIHDAILTHIESALQAALIDDLAVNDPTRAGVVMKGPLQGNPDPDQARIAVTLHENDPEPVYDQENTTISGEWTDEVAEIECGGSAIWNRRFTVMVRCLLIGDDLTTARQTVSKVRQRIELTLLKLSFAGVSSLGEYVSRGVLATSLKGETIQAGGPGNYDFYIKIRFEVQTTGVYS
jgi:hypothetical protein